MSNWPRPDASTSPDRLFCHTYGRARGQAQMIPGWPYSFVAALEPGRTSWTAVLDARRLGPADDATAGSSRAWPWPIRVADKRPPAAPRVLEVAAAGRVSNDDPGWLQVLADVLGRPVTHVTRRRATQRGTALLALDVLAPDVQRAPRATGATYEPRPAHVEHYAGRRARFAKVYDALLRG